MRPYTKYLYGNMIILAIFVEVILYDISRPSIIPVVLLPIKSEILPVNMLQNHIYLITTGRRSLWRPPWRTWGWTRGGGWSDAPWLRTGRTPPSRCCDPNTSPFSSTWPCGSETTPGEMKGRERMSLVDHFNACSLQYETIYIYPTFIIQATTKT